jgi:DNA-binding winged helix-turn-helix (wHTH) protein
MDAAHAPVPSMVIAGERPILVSTERNRSMSHALKLATLIPGTEAPSRSKDRKVPPFVGSRTPSERLQLVDAPVLDRFNPDSGFGVRGRVQSPHTGQLKPSEPAGATTSEVSFGPFRLLPAQFLLLEGDNPVPLGSRALAMLIVLLERPGELVSKQELMARVWPNLFVEPANLTVHMSALRRRLRDGRDGNRFIINIPGRGYCFVAPVTLGRGR